MKGVGGVLPPLNEELHQNGKVVGLGIVGEKVVLLHHLISTSLTSIIKG